jgi:DNA-binding MarR family transcriptional regulator
MDLASALSIDPSTASRLCTRLEDRRLVTARRSRQNKRELQIAITPRGQELLEAVLQGGLREIRSSLVAFGSPPEPLSLDPPSDPGEPTASP